MLRGVIRQELHSCGSTKRALLQSIYRVSSLLKPRFSKTKIETRSMFLRSEVALDLLAAAVDGVGNFGTCVGHRLSVSVCTSAYHHDEKAPRMLKRRQLECREQRQHKASVEFRTTPSLAALLDLRAASFRLPSLQQFA